MNSQLFGGVVVLAGLPLLFFGDTGIAYLKGWRTESRLDYSMIVIVSVVLASTMAFASSHSGRWLLKRRSPQIMICAIATICTWLVGECLLRGSGVLDASAAVHRHAPDTISIFRPVQEIMPGVQGESQFTVNSFGVRGPELYARGEAYRILCVGGSTTECLYLDDSEAWPHLLMENLNQRRDGAKVWVGNAGVSGHSTVRHLRFILEDTIWKEMDCVLFLVGANDFNGFLRYGITMKSPSDQSREQDLVLQSLQPMWKKSSVLEMIRHVYREWNRPRVLEEDATGLNYVARRKLRQNGHVRDDMPDLTDALSQYEARITRIIRECERAGVGPVFLTQPALLCENTPDQVRALFWSGDDGDGGYYKVEDLGRGLQKYNERLREVCTRHQVEFIELTSMNDHPEFFYDEYHFNEAGAREVARLVADGLTITANSKTHGQDTAR